MTKERLEELIAHIRVLIKSDEQSGRLPALELKQDIERLLEELKTKC